MLEIQVFLGWFNFASTFEEDGIIKIYQLWAFYFWGGLYIDLSQAVGFILQVFVCLGTKNILPWLDAWLNS